MKKSKQVDEYIKKSAPFAQPILVHLRNLVHEVCPDVEEKIKWSFPNFEYKGILCSMASFKQHCAFGFWKAALMKDAQKLSGNNDTAMGHLGQIKKLSDLPSDKILKAYIKEAMRLNDENVKLPSKQKSTEKKEIEVPDYFIAALKKNKAAFDNFENFAYSHKKEYLQWITEAKTEDTRNKRMTSAIEWLSEGKGRNWKYERK